MKKRLTQKEALDAVKAGMTDENCGHYVPVQKLTIAIAMHVTARYCKQCGAWDCEECTVSTMAEKLKEAIGQPAMFDENFNLLPPPKLERFSKAHSSEGLADALVGGFEEYCAECEKRGGRLCGRRTDSENRNLLLKCFARWATEETGSEEEGK